MSAMIKTVGERDYSAQEVMTVVFGWDLYNCSRKFTVLCINESEWTNVTVNHRDNSVTQGKKLLQKYRERPSSVPGLDWDKMTLLHFAKNHDVIKLRGQVHYTVRRKEAVVRIFPRLKLTNHAEQDEEYYRLHSILNSSFRETEDFDELLRPEYDGPDRAWLRVNPNEPHPSWRSKYDSLGLFDDSFELPEELEEEGEAPELIDEGDQHGPEMVAAAMINNVLIGRPEEPGQENLGKF